MESRKIVLLSSSDILFDQRLIKIATALQNFGAIVTLVGRKISNVKSINNYNYSEKRVDCIFNKGVLFYAEINLRYFFLLLFAKHDIVCANDADTLFGAWLASWFKNFDLYYDAHEIFTEVPELQGKYIKKRIWTWVEKKGIAKAKKTYTVNDSLAVYLQEKYNKHFDVIMNVPNLHAVQKDDLKPYILYQGALNKGRGLLEMIEAMQEINMTLKIAGGGDIEQELKGKVKELKLGGKVIFLGKLLPEELKSVTQNAFIGINLLDKNSLNYYYSLANKFFDYAHAGIPQISMNFPEYRKFNNENEVGILIDSLSKKEIVSAINKLILNQNYFKELSQNCITLSNKYNWEKEKIKLKEIYNLA